MTITWNPADSVGFTLTNGNLTATESSSGWLNCRANTGFTTGLLYVETTVGFNPGATTGSFAFGVANTSQTNFIGNNNSQAFGFYPSNGEISLFTSFIAPVPTGATFCVAYNFTSKLIWFRVGPGAWNNDGTADPGTSTGGLSFSAVTGTLFPVFTALTTGVATTTNFGATNFSFAIPTGYPGTTNFTAVPSPVNTPSLQRLLIRNDNAYIDPTIDDDQTARTLSAWRKRLVTSWVYANTSVSKYLQYDVTAPPDVDVSIAKFIQYDVVAPPDVDVSASKFSQYVVIETLPSIIRSPMLEIERRIINPWQQAQDDEEYSANFRRLKFRQYAGATAINANVNLTGVAGAGHAGTVTVEIDHGITGVAGHGEAGSLNAISGTAILGVAGIGQAGTVTAAVQTSILGVAGSGHAGTLASVLSPPILGVAGHGQAGTIGVRTEEGIVIAGVAGHGEVGTLTVSLNPLHTLPGLSAKGLAGTVGVHIDIDRPNIPIESAWGWGQAGTISTHQTTNLTGVAGHGQAGTLSTTTSQPGLIMVGLSGALLPSGTNDVYFSVRWSDDGGQTWGNPLVQSFGGTGNYLTFPTLKNLGQGRDRVFEISMSAPIATALSGIFVESEVVSS